MDRPLRLITANPVDQLARTVEALLVVASAPLTAAELADAADDEQERVELALGHLADRYREGRSGIVLEKVAGGFAFRASREAATACRRLFERPVERGLSGAAMETLTRLPGGTALVFVLTGLIAAAAFLGRSFQGRRLAAEATT